MMAERYLWNIQVEAPSWSIGEKTHWTRRSDRSQWDYGATWVWVGLSGYEQRDA